MKILAFQGYRYNSAQTVGDLTAPPFDQIDDALRDRLQASSSCHFAHLTRPKDGERGRLSVRRTHDRWLAEERVVQDQRPSLYPYAFELEGGRRRFGLACLVGVGPGSEADLRPHEHTVSKPLEDRLALLEATRIDLEPVMLLAEDEGELEEMLAADAASSPEVARFPTAPVDNDTTHVHRLHRIDDPTQIRLYQELLGGRFAVIADGHHRTKVAQLFAQKHAPASNSAASAKLAVLISLASSDLVIDPIHRGLRRNIDRRTLEDLAIRRSSWSGDNGGDFAKAIAEARQPAVGVWFSSGGGPEIWELDANAVPLDTPGGRGGLSVVLLQYQLFAAVGLNLDSASDGTVVYRSDPQELYNLVATSDIDSGFWLPPMSPEGFARATADGSVLPPKSTRFLPKLISGLVWSGHDARTL